MKKKLLVLLSFLFIMFSVSSIDAAQSNKRKWFERDSRIEIVNENTVIFKDVVKIEIKTTNRDQITYVYDLTHSKLIKVARGTFYVDLSRGDYLVQSDKRITKTVYDVIIE